MRLPLSGPRRARGPAAALVALALLGALSACSSDDAPATSPSSGTAAATTAVTAPTTSSAAPQDTQRTPQAVAPARFTFDADGTVTGITYPGQDGVTALELLVAADPSVGVTGSGQNAFVTRIGGRTADEGKHQFWKLQIDGADAAVGAGSLETKDGETVTWSIDTF